GLFVHHVVALTVQHSRNHLRHTLRACPQRFAEPCRAFHVGGLGRDLGLRLFVRFVLCYLRLHVHIHLASALQLFGRVLDIGLCHAFRCRLSQLRNFAIVLGLLGRTLLLSTVLDSQGLDLPQCRLASPLDSVSLGCQQLHACLQSFNLFIQ